MDKYKDKVPDTEVADMRAELTRWHGTFGILTPEEVRGIVDDYREELAEANRENCAYAALVGAIRIEVVKNDGEACDISDVVYDWFASHGMPLPDGT